jgi:hypothetical protein
VIPEEAVLVVGEQMLRRYDSQYSSAHLSWQDFADDAREDLEAALPALRRQWAEELGKRQQAMIGGLPGDVALAMAREFGESK